MLTIRTAQIEAFAEGSMQAYECELVRFLQTAWPRECHLAGDEAQLLRAVRRIVTSAQSHGMRSSRDMTLYALIVLSLGIEFDRDPQCRWAVAALGNLGIASPTARIEALYDEMVDYLGAVGGDDSERVVRALLRVRAHDFTRPPADDDGDLVEAICDQLEAFWPEKFAFQEATLTAAMVAAARARAGHHGIRDAAGVGVFATLAFFLGLGFDADPLHPWAAHALAAPASPAGPSRGIALMQAGLARLAASLSKD